MLVPDAVERRSGCRASPQSSMRPRGRGLARRAPDRELADRARSRRRTTCSTTRRSRSSARRRCPIRHCVSACRGSTLDGAKTPPLASRRRSTSAESCWRALGRALHPGGDDRRRGAGGRGGAVTRRRLAIASARGRRGVRARGRRRRRRRRPGAFTRFVALAPYTQVDGGERLADGAVVRHRPPPGRALPRARTARSQRASTSCSSCRGRCRTRRGATASTSSSTGTSSTTTVRPALEGAARADARAAPLRLLRRRGRAMSGARSSARSGTRMSSPSADDAPSLLYVDLHLVHEVTSPQAFEALRARRPRRCGGPT